MIDTSTEEYQRRSAATFAAAKRMHDAWVQMGRQWRDPATRKWRKGGACRPECPFCPQAVA